MHPILGQNQTMHLKARPISIMMFLVPLFENVTLKSNEIESVNEISSIGVDVIGGGASDSNSTHFTSESVQGLKPCAAGNLCRAPWIK